MLENIAIYEQKNGYISQERVDFWKGRRGKKWEEPKELTTAGGIFKTYFLPSKKGEGEWYAINDILNFLREVDPKQESVQQANVVTIGKEIGRFGFERKRRLTGRIRGYGYWVKRK